MSTLLDTSSILLDTINFQPNEAKNDSVITQDTFRPYFFPQRKRSEVVRFVIDNTTQTNSPTLYHLL